MLLTSFKAGVMFSLGFWAGLLFFSNTEDAMRYVAREHRHGKHLRSGYRP